MIKRIREKIKMISRKTSINDFNYKSRIGKYNIHLSKNYYNRYSRCKNICETIVVL